MSELQIKYDRLAVQLRGVTPECGTGRSLERERCDDSTNLRALPDLYEYGFNRLEGHIAVIRKTEKAVAIKREAGSYKAGAS